MRYVLIISLAVSCLTGMAIFTGCQETQPPATTASDSVSDSSSGSAQIGTGTDLGTSGVNVEP
jgi:hypothetical protein